MAKKISKENGEFTSIAGAVGGTTIAMIALIVIFAPSFAWVIAPIVFSMSLFGILLGYFASKKSKERRES